MLRWLLTLQRGFIMKLSGRFKDFEVTMLRAALMVCVQYCIREHPNRIALAVLYVAHFSRIR